VWRTAAAAFPRAPASPEAALFFSSARACFAAQSFRFFGSALGFATPAASPAGSAGAVALRRVVSTSICVLL
jgi:hypothetical protein